MTTEAAPILVASDPSSRSDRPLDRALSLAAERSCPLLFRPLEPVLPLLSPAV